MEDPKYAENQCHIVYLVVFGVYLIVSIFVYRSSNQIYVREDEITQADPDKHKMWTDKYGDGKCRFNSNRTI